MFLEAPKSFTPTLMFGSLGLMLPTPKVAYNAAELMNITKQVMYGGQIDFLVEIQKLGYGGITSYSQESYSYTTMTATGMAVANGQIWKIGLGGASPFSTAKGEIMVMRSGIDSQYENLTISMLASNATSSAMVSQNLYHDYKNESWFQNTNASWLSEGIRFDEKTHFAAYKDGNFDSNHYVGFVGVADPYTALLSIF